MSTEVDPVLVASAQSGDLEALDRLIAQFLPLVYNIAGRAMPCRADVDDVVQNTMLRVIRGLPGLHSPHRFRAWLAAITMNEIREYYQAHRVRLHPLDEVAEVADPGADFADLTLTKLGLSGQRREVVEATRWLDPDDRELLSLWWLVVAGHLSRADMITAVGLNAHHVTVRIARMKAQLQTARQVVRALAAVPRCPGLADPAQAWDGQPGTLWRKRLARHIRDCVYCSGAGTDLVPAERLLANLALVPLAAGYLSVALSHAHGARATTVVASRLARHVRVGPHLGFAVKPLVVAVAIAATAGVAAISLPTAFGSSHSTSQTQAAPSVSGPIASIAPSGAVSSSALPATSPATPATSPARAVSARPSSQKITEPPSPEDQVLAVINQARADQGLQLLTRDRGLDAATAAHNQAMASNGCGMNHQCPGEASVGQRAADAGVPWAAGWECIALGGPVDNTNEAIADMAVGMTKDMVNEQPPGDGHRSIILRKDARHVGIAVLRDGSGGVYMTQDFSD